MLQRFEYNSEEQVLECNPDGRYVTYEDYQALEAVLEQRDIQIANVSELATDLNERYVGLFYENKDLKNQLDMFESEHYDRQITGE